MENLGGLYIYIYIYTYMSYIFTNTSPNTFTNTFNPNAFTNTFPLRDAVREPPNHYCGLRHPRVRKGVRKTFSERCS